MKKLISIPNSLVPFWQKDLTYMTSGIMDSFAAILGTMGFGRDYYIISGCTINRKDNTVSMAAGWAWWNGEILPVKELPATQCTDGTVRIKLTKVKYFNDEGKRQATYTDNTVDVNMWQEDYLEPSLVKINDLYDLAIEEGFWNLQERIVRHSAIIDSGEKSVRVSVGYGNIAYRKIGGSVQIFGSLWDDASVNISGEVVTGLPRPIRELNLPLGNGSAKLTLDGTLYAYTESNRVSFDNICYLSVPAVPNNTDDKHFSTLANNDEGDIIS